MLEMNANIGLLLNTSTKDKPSKTSEYDPMGYGRTGGREEKSEKNPLILLN